MGIIAIRKRMGRGMKYLFGGFLVVFAVGIFMGFGGGGGRGPGPRGSRLAAEGPAVMATVEGQKISRNAFYGRYVAYRGGRTIRALGKMRDVKLNILEQMVHQVLIARAAKAENIEVKEEDVNAALTADVDRWIQGQYPSKSKLAAYLKNEGMTIEELRGRIRGSFASTRDYSQIVSIQKLQAKVSAGVKLSEKAVKESYRERKVQLILVRPEGSLLPSSPAIDTPAPTPLTGAEDKAARKRADDIVKRLRAGADFGEVAEEESAEPRSAAQGGDVQYHRRASLDESLVATYLAQWPWYIPVARPERVNLAVYRAARALEKPIFEGKIGEVSDPIRTDWGYVIVRVPEAKNNVPEDFDERKEQYKKSVEDEARRASWARYYYGKLRANAEIDVQDAELQAYLALQEGDKEKAYTLLKKAVAVSKAGSEDDPGDAVQNFELGRLAEALEKDEEAVSHYKAAAETSGAAHDVHIALGKLYGKLGKKAYALLELRAASDAADTNLYENVAVHEELETLYAEMGKDILSDEQQKWVDDFRAEEMRRLERLRAGS